MLLSELLDGFEYTIMQGSLDISITEVVKHNKEMVPGALFVCIQGASVDSHSLIDDVVSQGAAALIVQQEVSAPGFVTIIRVENTQIVLAQIAAAFFGYPQKRLRMVGITGTKGKTTTAYMIRHILEEAGIRTGLIGTVEVLYGNQKFESVNTTPDSFLLFRYLRKMADAGCECVVMEVSSQGLMLHRVAGLLFDYAVFTNISPDHIGPKEHKDFNEYLNCKSMLFKQCRIGIINADDGHCAEILKDHNCMIESYGISNMADLQADDLMLVRGGHYLGIRFQASGCLHYPMELHMPGVFNVYNALAALSVCRHFGVGTATMSESLKNVVIKGRLEMIPTGKPYQIMIDYAHNPVSLEALLKTIRSYEPKRIVCLFGCGGGRAKIRRQYMGETAAQYADYTVITSDNPRNENPNDIINDILSAFHGDIHKYTVIPDRREAIRFCIDHAAEGDIIILAGKGHESYQEIKGIHYPMKEREIVTDILSEQEFQISDFISD